MKTKTVKFRDKECVCKVPQHGAVLGDETASARAPRVAAGPIAVMPEHDDVKDKEGDIFRDAVTNSGGVLSELNQDTRGLIWLSQKKATDLYDVLSQNPQLTWVQLPWAGVDAYSSTLKELARPNLVFTSAKGAYAQPVAEHALAMTLALLRMLPRRARAHSWEFTPRGISLYGRNIVIIGAGGIARELIRLLEPFGASITIVRRNSEPVPGAGKTVNSAALMEVLPDADVVVVAAALTSETTHLIGAEQLSIMKPSAVLVNIARGPLVDPAALLEALNSGRLHGAALDVTEPEPLPDGHPLWSAENVLITPHNADTPDMVAPLLAARIAYNVKSFLEGEQFIGVVDTDFGY